METEHRAELIKLPSREHSFWDLVGAYRQFSELDLTGFDVVVSSKYPAWMVRHPRHVVYMLHKLRGLYDTYHFLGMPDEYPDAPAAVRDWRAFAAANHGRRDALGEHFERLAALRDQPADLFAFPGPFIREVVHALDAIGLAPQEIRRYGAIAGEVRRRADYFPAGAEVFVAHPPTGLAITPGRGRGSHVLTASRLDGAKRVASLISMMRCVPGDVPLVIAGAGPDGEQLRELAAADARIRFAGRVSDRELIGLYRDARVVAYVPYYEDYGYVTLEAMLAGRPVLTATDSGGTNELVQDGVTGRIVEPTDEALGAALTELWNAGRRTRQAMRDAALQRAGRITWDAVVAELVA